MTKPRTSRRRVSRTKRRMSRQRKKRTSRAPTAAPKAVRSSTYEEQQAVAEAHRLLAKWKVPGYTVAFSNRMTNAMGKVNHRSKVVQFSRPLWERASATERREVVIHEVAHAVVAHVHGRQPGVSHGAKWKAQMRAMGIRNPSRTHSVNREGLKRQRSDTVAIDCCGKISRITLKRLHRALGRGVKCRCGQAIRFASQQDRDRFDRYLAQRLTANVCGLGRQGKR